MRAAIGIQPPELSTVVAIQILAEHLTLKTENCSQNCRNITLGGGRSRAATPFACGAGTLWPRITQASRRIFRLQRPDSAQNWPGKRRPGRPSDIFCHRHNNSHLRVGAKNPYCTICICGYVGCMKWQQFLTLTLIVVAVVVVLWRSSGKKTGNRGCKCGCDHAPDVDQAGKKDAVH